MPIDFAKHPPDPFLEYIFMRQELSNAWQENADLSQCLLHPKGHVVVLLGGISTYRVVNPQTRRESETKRRVYLERRYLTDFSHEPKQAFRHAGYPARDYSNPAYEQKDTTSAVDIARDRLVLRETALSAEDTEKEVEAYQRLTRAERIWTEDSPEALAIQDAIMGGVEAHLRGLQE